DEVVLPVVAHRVVRGLPALHRGGAAAGAVVAVGEHGELPGGGPRVRDVPEERVVDRVAALPPGVVDDVRALTRPRVLAVQVGGGQGPLAGGQQIALPAGPLPDTPPRRDPLCPGCHADPVLATVGPDHGAHHVCAVPD